MINGKLCEFKLPNYEIAVSGTIVSDAVFCQENQYFYVLVLKEDGTLQRVDTDFVTLRLNAQQPG